MNIAEQIKGHFSQYTESGWVTDVSALMDDAAERAQRVEQDWDNEATSYHFVDGSALVVSGPFVSTYGSAE